MSTTVLKSWSEFIRLTDPLIWSLAMEGNSASAEPENDFDTNSISLHFQQRQQLHDLVKQEKVQKQPQQPKQPQHQQQHQQHMVLYNGSHTTSSPESMPSSHNKNNNCCKSLLDPRSQNTLDWLKCLIQTTQDGNSKDHVYKSQKERDPQISLDGKMDFGPVGEAISKRRSSMRSALSRSIDSDEPTTAAVPDSSLNGNQRHQQSSTKPFSNPSSPNSLLSRSENLTEGNGMSSFTGSSPNVQSNTSSNTQNLSNSQSTSAPVSLATVAAAAVAAHRIAEAEARSKGSLDHHNFDHSSTVNTRTSTTSNSTSIATTTAAATAAATAATTLVAPVSTKSGITSHMNDGSTNDNSSKGTTPSSSSSSRFSFIIPTKEFFYSSAGVIQNGVIKSKDATTAFLYRTFSPTYRISSLYIDSFGNGSQVRGLERIKNSMVRGDALSLAKGTTTQMKDIWTQIMISYRAKKHKANAISSTSKKVPSSSSFASASTTSTSNQEEKKCASGDNTTNSDSNSSQNTDNKN
ncbi:hypothetical protein BGZ76_011176 [Entomortierella beljakovae]|nr:hypothetical protein BGZ76_011176 [Entomortierella beljakovae]